MSGLRPSPYHDCVRWMRWALVAGLVTVGLTLSVDASARVLAPPGHAGTNQYVEVIPTSGGNAAPPGTVRGSGSSQAPAHALAPFGQGSKGDTSLAKLGPDGQAAAELAASTAPAHGPGGASRNGKPRPTTPAGGGSVASGRGCGPGLPIPARAARAVERQIGRAHV